MYRRVIYNDIDTYEIDNKKMMFLMVNGVLSIKAGGGYLPVNQYFSLHPIVAEVEFNTSPLHEQKHRRHSADRKAAARKTDPPQIDDTKVKTRPTSSISKSPSAQKRK